MHFVYEALTSDGRAVRDRLEAAGSREAADALRARGLLIVSLEASRPGPGGGAPGAWRCRRQGASSSDLVVFTRQMKMLLESGAGVVPALEAIGRQAARPAFRALVGQLRDRVEKGASLSEAFRQRPEVFKPVFCSMVAAGEATGNLPQAFARLARLAQQQRQTRKQLLGALLYPALLSVLVAGVVAMLFGFVIPRFRQLFRSLNLALPLTTQFMFELSDALAAYWPLLLAGALGGALAVLLLLRSPRARAAIDGLLLRLPLVGRLAGRIEFARILRVWAAMLRSHVPLLEAIEHSRPAASNAAFARLVERVREAVASGGRVGRVLADSPLVEPVVASAIATGEENGRLAEAVEFTSAWMDEDNSQLVGAVARLAEPVLLTLMGLVVGAAALALFIPLFDIASAAG